MNIESYFVMQRVATKTEYYITFDRCNKYLAIFIHGRTTT